MWVCDPTIFFFGLHSALPRSCPGLSILATLAFGGTVVLMYKPEISEIIDLIEKERVTFVSFPSTRLYGNGSNCKNFCKGPYVSQGGLHIRGAHPIGNPAALQRDIAAGHMDQLLRYDRAVAAGRQQPGHDETAIHRKTAHSTGNENCR